jgi:ATP-dependent RNA circularization protein (DNA/RNA ligase family)
MIEYPSIINSSKAPRKPMIAFEKLDGSNIRVKYTAKRGFELFGTRTQLLDESHGSLGGVIPIFNRTCKEPLEEVLGKFYPKEREVIAFGEYVGPNSFAGFHKDPPELMQFVLFDIMFIKNNGNTFLTPQEFVKFVDKLNGMVPTPRVIYEGNLTDDFIKRVRANEFEVNEGVVCKGKETTGTARGKVWMCKIKTQAYLDKLKGQFREEYMKYWE